MGRMSPFGGGIRGLLMGEMGASLHPSVHYLKNWIRISGPATRNCKQDAATHSLTAPIAEPHMLHDAMMLMLC